MANPKKRSRHSKTMANTGRSVVYRGKQARTGNSLALRFDHALFKSHPEFSGEVEAHVLGRGRMLVVATGPDSKASNREDPVIASFLSYLAADMQRSPHRIQPLDSRLIERIEKLTRGMSTDSDESLGDEALI